MPLIDVSIAITSPMLCDQFVVIRRTQVMGANGRATWNATNLGTQPGVVYPSSKNDLERFPNLQVQSKTITVITRFALRGESEVSGTDFGPDIVQWNGDNYLVVGLEDWSHFGPGFLFAVCQSMDLKDAPPATE